MGYTVLSDDGRPAPLRRIWPNGDGTMRVGQPFRPEDWNADPGRWPHSRYTVWEPAGAETYAFWEIVEPDDNDDTIAYKLRQAAAVDAAGRAIEDARIAYRRLTNREYER